MNVCVPQQLQAHWLSAGTFMQCALCVAQGIGVIYPVRLLGAVVYVVTAGQCPAAPECADMITIGMPALQSGRH